MTRGFLVHSQAVAMDPHGVCLLDFKTEGWMSCMWYIENSAGSRNSRLKGECTSIRRAWLHTLHCISLNKHGAALPGAGLLRCTQKLPGQPPQGVTSQISTGKAYRLRSLCQQSDLWQPISSGSKCGWYRDDARTRTLDRHESRSARTPHRW